MKGWGEGRGEEGVGWGRRSPSCGFTGVALDLLKDARRDSFSVSDTRPGGRHGFSFYNIIPKDFLNVKKK